RSGSGHDETGARSGRVQGGDRVQQQPRRRVRGPTHERFHDQGNKKSKRRANIADVEAADITMSLSEENIQVLNLVQAMIGAVSPNLRRVTLEVPRPSAVHLRFVLERDDADDREEIEDIGFKFEALQTTGIELEIDTIVDGTSIGEFRVPGRAVFGRKE
ncbi:MAG: hypothetical protein AAGF11_50110, partial [Myxococcota bacterium]